MRLISYYSQSKNLFHLHGQLFKIRQQLLVNHGWYQQQQQPHRQQYHDNKKWKLPTAGYDTNIKVYNPVVGEKVSLILRHKGLATWYSCGPTVYDSSHIGHASCYVRQDIIQRILTDYFQINLITAMNITDIDDKIIQRAADATAASLDAERSGGSQFNSEGWQQIAQKYEQEFWFDLKTLNCRLPNVTLRVSQHIPHIISFIEKLLANSMAYVTPNDGSVYFHVNKLKNYGKLHKFNGNLVNISIENRLKKSPFDFALWKGRPPPSTTDATDKNNNSQKFEPIWSVPWSKYGGRPGWHIECSTMASKLFGNSLDFHSGGWDLLFPHHENEEAQSCAHHCVDQWVNYWIHTGQLHLTGDETKMSKSLKNTISIKELMLENGKNAANQFRMICTLSNYQNQIDFSETSMLNAGFVLKRFDEFDQDVQAYLANQKPLPLMFDSEKIYKNLIKINEEIDTALRDNFNTAKSIELLLNLINYTNKMLNSPETGGCGDGNGVNGQIADCGSIRAVANCVNKFLNIFGFVSVNSAASFTANNDNSLVDTILDIRMLIRKKAITNKDKELFELCDNIRDRLKNTGIIVKDHGKTSSWSKS